MLETVLSLLKCMRNNVEDDKEDLITLIEKWLCSVLFFSFIYYGTTVER